MLDKALLYVRGGNGGDGCVSFRREKFVPYGGPDGGDGGVGGDVYLIASLQENTLAKFQRGHLVRAQDGGHGSGNQRHGKDGEDVELTVPAGTVVCRGREGSQGILGDLTVDGQRLRVASGGRGGRGNARFVGAVNQVPRLAEVGEEGEEVTLRLELQLLADVGIVGKPNAGKSTLLATISSARPKIADYPFTTTEPLLGVVGTLREVLIFLEIPGLISGAHQGAGLGLEFLRHVERTRALLFMVDASSADPLKDLREVRQELEAYRAALLARPAVVALNKVDISGVRERAPELAAALAREGFSALPISAATGEGLPELLEHVRALVAQAPKPPLPSSPPPAQAMPVRPRREGSCRVYREGETFVVESPPAARLAAGSNLQDRGARLQFMNELQRMRVLRELERAKVRRGDRVRFGKVEIEWG